MGHNMSLRIFVVKEILPFCEIIVDQNVLIRKSQLCQTLILFEHTMPPYFMASLHLHAVIYCSLHKNVLTNCLSQLINHYYPLIDSCSEYSLSHIIVITYILT